MAPIVIVGTGLAGYSLAREIRKLDDKVPLHLITADEGSAYSKPMLSNALLNGKTADELVSADAAQMADQLRARVDTHCRVQSIDRIKKQVITAKGALRYDRLVLALGADPIRLSFSGVANGDVLSINDLDDYSLFRQRLAPDAEVLIMGAGLIGCEFSNDLAATGHPVTVIDPGEQPLGRLLPHATASALKEALQATGVNWRFGVTATSIEKRASRFIVTLSDNAQLEADLILSAVGLRARVALAELSGLACNRGIVVDRFLSSSDQDIFALGDCAEICGLVLPFVMPIMHAARALARTLCGTPTAVTFPAMPVVVKTPSCPLAFAPPPADQPGDWSVEEVPDGTIAHFRRPDGTLAGFALTGRGVSKKQELAKELPPALA